MDPYRKTLTDQKIFKLYEVINILREYDREMPAQLLSTLLYIASHKDCHKQALEDPNEGLGLSTAAASRCTDWLSHKHWVGKQGLGLIIKEADPCNRRRLQLRLTKKGEVLVARIKRILYDET
tara:strand:+ start:1760 stop:2128 length:369 start_codon:yes stop_codon:yes gene_type:complete